MCCITFQLWLFRLCSFASFYPGSNHVTGPAPNPSILQLLDLGLKLWLPPYRKRDWAWLSQLAMRIQTWHLQLEHFVKLTVLYTHIIHALTQLWKGNLCESFIYNWNSRNRQFCIHNYDIPHSRLRKPKLTLRWNTCLNNRLWKLKLLAFICKIGLGSYILHLQSTVPEMRLLWIDIKMSVEVIGQPNWALIYWLRLSATLLCGY